MKSLWKSASLPLVHCGQAPSDGGFLREKCPSSQSSSRLFKHGSYNKHVWFSEKRKPLNRMTKTFPFAIRSLKAKKNFSPINWNEVKSRPRANKAKSRTEDKIAKVLKEHGMFVVYSVYLSASHIHLLHLFGRCCFWNMFFSESHIASMSFIHPTLIQSAYCKECPRLTIFIFP